MTGRVKWRSVGVGVGLVVMFGVALGTGCKGDDEFANVKPLRAPGVSATSTAPRLPAAKSGGAPGGMPGGATPTRAPALQPGAQLPANHPPVVNQGGAAGAAPTPAGKIPGSGGPLRWAAPKGWMAVKPSSSMRLAEYRIPAPKGVEPGVMTVFYFGRGQGGKVDANINRWIGQFTQPDGKPSTAAAKRSTRKVNGLDVHLVDVTGTFGGGMGGGGAKENQRMLGAIAMSPVGPFFFKLVGPKAVIDANTQQFDQFVASFAPGQ